MAWSMDWWTVLGWAGFGIGLVVAAWALLWDRARGRLRCPKCWYDMRSAENGYASRCPECGRQVRREKELKRTRRRWRWGIPAVFVMLIGFTAGAVHDPAGIRSRGWVAAVPTMVLVMIAPVTDAISISGSLPEERTVYWNPDPQPGSLRELNWRLSQGQLAVWEARWLFRRVEREHSELVEELIRVDLPRVRNADLFVDGGSHIVVRDPRPSVPGQIMYYFLPHRVRIVGLNTSAWHYKCECGLDMGGMLIVESALPGRYIVECEYYLPRQPNSYLNFGNPMSHQGRNGEFDPNRLVWTIRRIVDVELAPRSTHNAWRGSVPNEYWARILDGVVRDQNGDYWFKTTPSHLLTMENIPDPGIAFGAIVELRDSHGVVATGRVLLNKELRHSIWYRPRLFPVAHRLRTVREPIEGDLLAVRIIGSEAVSMRHNMADFYSAPIQHYWSDVYELPAYEARKAHPGTDAANAIELWHRMHTWSDVVPMKD